MRVIIESEALGRLERTIRRARDLLAIHQQIEHAIGLLFQTNSAATLIIRLIPESSPPAKPETAQ